MFARHRFDSAGPAGRYDMPALLRALVPGRAPAAEAARSAARRHGRVAATPVIERPDRGLWAIAEGIGSDAASDIAAAAVIDALAVLADAAPPGPDAIRTVLSRANRAVRAARLSPGRVSGATVVALRLADGIATILWVGDDRAYRCRDGALALLTRDHDVARELSDAGTPAPHALAVPHAEIVARAIGLAPEIEIETITVPVAAGDRLLLCSRALAARMPAAMIASRLRAPVDQAAEALVEAASCADAGGTVAVLAIEVR